MPKFSAQHYKVIAGVVCRQRREAQKFDVVGRTYDLLISSFALELASEFSLDNPRFNLDWFLQACDPQTTEKRK